MKLCIIAAACLAVVSCASISLEDLEFHAWKLKFGKSYKSIKEEAYRKDIWLSSRRRVLAHNILADQGIHTYRRGMNQFADMEQEEFFQTFLKNMALSNETKAKPHAGRRPSAPKRASAKLPVSVDWRDSGCVTPVKDQKECKAFWAFSVTGALESHTCIKYGRNTSLSEQQLVDCTMGYGERGCSGGSMNPAFQYISDVGGIDSEKSYPYMGTKDKCKFSPSGVAANCSGYADVLPRCNESALQWYVSNVGPMAVAVDASRFHDYESGIFFDPTCSSVYLNHAVLVVGYGTSGLFQQDYWLVKNCWGEIWGERGFMKITRNRGNHCGIASFASYPLV